MPDLEMLLREVRPVPDPAWATKLDARVAARFPGPPPRWKAPLIVLRDHMLAFGTVATVASLLIVLVIAAPSLHFSGSSDSDEGGSSAGGTASKSAASPPAATTAPESLSRTQKPTQFSTDSAAGGAPQSAQRHLKTTTSLTLTTTPYQVHSVSDRAIR